MRVCFFVFIMIRFPFVWRVGWWRAQRHELQSLGEGYEVTNYKFNVQLLDLAEAIAGPALAEVTNAETLAIDKAKANA